MSHLAPAISRELIDLGRPFSSFTFAEQRFSGSPPIRKLFSIGRGRDAKSLLLETVPAIANVAEENEDLAALDSGFVHLALVRISFWKVALAEENLQGQLQSRDCLGYALLKEDFLSTHGRPCWHVYEAVIRPYPHTHNYVNARAVFTFDAAGTKIQVEGCLYAQQNGLNKTCAQVGIRSLAATYLKTNSISYRTINALAAAGEEDFHPSNGLTNAQISKALTGLGIDHQTIDYDQIENDPEEEFRFPAIRSDLPFEKLLYSGIESGAGALMAFNLGGISAPAMVGHLIPFFGHTFNEDSWAPNAESAYFHIGETIRYIPSRSWLSSFLIHDDNFGANLCVPQRFIAKEQVSCIFELFPQGWKYSGFEAEVAASDYFYSILPNVPDPSHLPWLRRLRSYVGQQQLILRHVPITRDQYLAELAGQRDWEDHGEAAATIDEFRARGGPEKLWMVEVSVPEVFPTNKRKLGEILLDATRDLSSETDGSSFVLARLPGCFVFFDSTDDSGVPTFVSVASALQSHLPLFSPASQPEK